MACRGCRPVLEIDRCTPNWAPASAGPHVPRKSLMRALLNRPRPIASVQTQVDHCQSSGRQRAALQAAPPMLTHQRVQAAAAPPLAAARQQVCQQPVQRPCSSNARRGTPAPAAPDQPCRSLPAPCSSQGRRQGPTVSAGRRRGLLAAQLGVAAAAAACDVSQRTAAVTCSHRWLPAGSMARLTCTMTSWMVSAAGPLLACSVAIARQASEALQVAATCWRGFAGGD